ncbi:hypothetical protein AAAX56_08840 [Hominicoprocola fusiformis]
MIDPNLIGTTSLYQPFGQVRFLAGLSTFFRGRAAGEMHLKRDFAFTEDDFVNIMNADKFGGAAKKRRCGEIDRKRRCHYALHHCTGR